MVTIRCDGSESEEVRSSRSTLTVDLRALRITIVTHLWLCLREYFQKGLVKQGKHTLKMGGTNPRLSSWTEWREDSKRASAIPLHPVDWA